MMTLTNEARNEIVEYLENNNIQTRNMTRHPMFDSMVLNRIVGELTVTDMIMTNSFWIGLYPGMGDEAIHYMIEKIRGFVNG